MVTILVVMMMISECWLGQCGLDDQCTVRARFTKF